ncbi:MAG: hypothetical protein WDO14_21155 [Bacteroidota bacterium]
MKRLICLLFLPVFGYAQQYRAEAPLSRVEKSGFYSIPLPPHVTASLYADGRNVRIFDSNQVEIPYIFKTESPDFSEFEWAPMKIEKEVTRGCCTVITVINEDKSYIDNFLLQVKNAVVNKTATLRGSDDEHIWYAVAENFQLTFGRLNAAEVSEIFDFPLSNYKYYRLTINDSTTSPLNVVGALRTREDIIHGSFTEIPNVAIASHDSTRNRETWGIIEFDTAQYVDRIEFDVYGPHLFKRRATLFKKVKNRLQEIESFDIISGQARPLVVGLKEKELFIRVDNDNNPPLQFTQVAAYQLNRSLVTYLEAGKNYKIVLENSLQAPTYDLKFFADSIPSHSPELEIGALKENVVLKEADTSPTIFTSRMYIWVAIFLVGILLAVMAVRMLRDVKNE